MWVAWRLAYARLENESTIGADLGAVTVARETNWRTVATVFFE
jgi:hypothetical protein